MTSYKFTRDIYYLNIFSSLHSRRVVIALISSRMCVLIETGRHLDRVFPCRLCCRSPWGLYQWCTSKGLSQALYGCNGYANAKLENCWCFCFSLLFLPNEKDVREHLQKACQRTAAASPFTHHHQSLSVFTIYHLLKEWKLEKAQSDLRVLFPRFLLFTDPACANNSGYPMTDTTHVI